ncbi:hypothetical protein KKH23_03635 [Patescibacteria group bacterium]|nr:hypothetical protein [Patescibacteria group bacterium]MBU0776864.1 hypothetical protein [Patescibacteria group bacterium]MBU0846257.1 hypothetical protein [Patescibacteria group bacterium]MBU0922604.1 hypothetical protein [Patescibacteria group bacterium]MBU1066655.1 hypothetical protein [Patescibacteria group bacterium]
MKNTAPKSSKNKWSVKIRKLINSRWFIAIIPALITGLFSYFAAINTANTHIASLRSDFQVQNSNVQKQSQTVITSETGSTLSVSDEGEFGNELGKSFDIVNWLFASGMTPDKEGFYCPPKNPAFPSWVMWTANKYLVDREVSITFSLKDKTDNNKNPTFFISYGDKSNDVPDSFYRINVFDGDLNTIRLRDRNDDEVTFERSVSDAPLDKYITLSLSPVFPNKKLPLLTINPAVLGPEYEFEPGSAFEINLPISSSESQGDGFQYGLGVSTGDCFKIISSNL